MSMSAKAEQISRLSGALITEASNAEVRLVLLREQNSSLKSMLRDVARWCSNEQLGNEARELLMSLERA
jgi:hypothetical protein